MGIQAPNGDLVEAVQKPIYELVTLRHLWQLDLTGPDGAWPHVEGILRKPGQLTLAPSVADRDTLDALAGLSGNEVDLNGLLEPTDCVADPEAPTEAPTGSVIEEKLAKALRKFHSPMASHADLECKVQIVGGSVIPTSMARSELEDDGLSLDGTDAFNDTRDAVAEASVALDGPMWVSICSVLILFSAAAFQAPRALLDRRNVHVASVDMETRTIVMKNGNQGHDIVVVVLLSDARWKEVYLPQLELKFNCVEDLDAW